MQNSVEIKMGIPGGRLFLNDLPADLLITGSVAIDTETMGLKIGRDRLCLVQMADEKGNVYFVKLEAQNAMNSRSNSPNLVKLLINNEVQKIFHFARFDLAVLYQTFGVMTENVYCTKIASKLGRTYTDSHGLKELVREFIGANISKAQQSSDWGNSSLSDEQLKYAAGDVIYLHRIKNSLDMMLERENRIEILKKCLEFLPSRAYMDVHGYEAVDIFAHS